MIDRAPNLSISFRTNALTMAAVLLSCGNSGFFASSTGLVPAAFGIGRREAMLAASTAVIGGLSWMKSAPALADVVETPSGLLSDAGRAEPSSSTRKPPSFASYSIIPDSSETLNPTLNSIDQDTFFKALGSSEKGGVVWLGEHHNSAKDHKIQQEIIRKLYDTQTGDIPMAIGLEQVQVQFQSVLDDYVSGKIDVETMKQVVQWETRWTWPFDQYRLIFETARELGIRLVALNVDSEDLALVEKDGFPGLGRTQILKYISDPSGFAEFVKPVQFQTYVDYVIRPSYDLHKAVGLLQYSLSGQKLEEEMSLRNFFSGRILWVGGRRSSQI